MGTRKFSPSTLSPHYRGIPDRKNSASHESEKVVLPLVVVLKVVDSRAVVVRKYNVLSGSDLKRTETAIRPRP
jgi:hypothetical protein